MHDIWYENWGLWSTWRRIGVIFCGLLFTYHIINVGPRYADFIASGVSAQIWMIVLMWFFVSFPFSLILPLITSAFITVNLYRINIFKHRWIKCIHIYYHRKKLSRKMVFQQLSEIISWINIYVTYSILQ